MRLIVLIIASRAGLWLNIALTVIVTGSALAGLTSLSDHADLVAMAWIVRFLVVRTLELEAALLARDSYRLALLRAWDDVDRYRRHLGLGRKPHPEPEDLLDGLERVEVTR